MVEQDELIAERIGVSESRVSQILTKTIESVRKYIDRAVTQASGGASADLSVGLSEEPMKNTEKIDALKPEPVTRKGVHSAKASPAAHPTYDIYLSAWL